MLHCIIELTLSLVEELPVVSFRFLALAVTSYVPLVGWIAFGLKSAFVTFLGVLWLRLWCC